MCIYRFALSFCIFILIYHKDPKGAFRTNSGDLHIVYFLYFRYSINGGFSTKSYRHIINVMPVFGGYGKITTNKKTEEPHIF